jgi:acetyl esterase/lipase
MIAGQVETMKDSLAEQVAQTGVQVFSVNYRLAPENPHPVPIEDCYAALLWVREHSKEFYVDMARLAVQGESAGAGLAAGVSLLARDRKLNPPLAKQFLVYPMLDDRNQKSFPKELDVYVVWKSADNETGWRALLGDAYQTESVSPYAAPARAESVEGLPSTYMDVGSLDLFRDECIAFIARLAAQNVDTEFHIYPGVPHAFEILAPDIPVTKRAGENRFNAIRRF